MSTTIPSSSELATPPSGTTATSDGIAAISIEITYTATARCFLTCRPTARRASCGVGRRAEMAIVDGGLVERMAAKVRVPDSLPVLALRQWTVDDSEKRMRRLVGVIAETLGYGRDRGDL